MLLFLQAKRCSLHWFLYCVESLCCGVNVGYFWTHQQHPSNGICPAGHVCQVLHHLQPDHLSNAEAKHPQDDAQGHVYSLPYLREKLLLPTAPGKLLLKARDQGQTSYHSQAKQPTAFQPLCTSTVCCFIKELQ